MDFTLGFCSSDKGLLIGMPSYPELLGIQDVPPGFVKPLGQLGEMLPEDAVTGATLWKNQSKEKDTRSLNAELQGEQTGVSGPQE